MHDRAERPLLDELPQFIRQIARSCQRQLANRCARRAAARDDGDGHTPDRPIDLIILATPHALHSAQIAAAAWASRHVFCEKPIGLTVAEVRRSLDACRAARIRLGVGHERRFEPAIAA